MLIHANSDRPAARHYVIMDGVSWAEEALAETSDPRLAYVQVQGRPVLSWMASKGWKSGVLVRLVGEDVWNDEGTTTAENTLLVRADAESQVAKPGRSVKGFLKNLQRQLEDEGLWSESCLFESYDIDAARLAELGLVVVNIKSIESEFEQIYAG